MSRSSAILLFIGQYLNPPAIVWWQFNLVGQRPMFWISVVARRYLDYENQTSAQLV